MALVDQAIAQGVDGIASPVWVPEAQVPALKRASDQGIVITLFNTGQNHMEELSTLNYFGSDECIAGVAGGEYLAGQGASHIQIPDAGAADFRKGERTREEIAGLMAGGGSMSDIEASIAGDAEADDVHAH